MPRNPATRRSEHGVTLLELLVVVAAAVILASLAIPGYNGYITRSRNALAIGDIGTLSLQLYRWQASTRSLPATLAEAGLGAPLDPWGRPYVYQRVAGSNNAQLRKDKNLVPINTDFDLYSVGPDGQTAKPLTNPKSFDDIVRANDGAYIGPGKSY
jgi:general secretion pathway protein G